MRKMEIKLRAVAKEDRAILFEWANDPLTRKMSFRQEPIGWDEHLKWFEKALRGEGFELLVAEIKIGKGWTPAGRVIFKPDGEIGITLGGEFRGRRLARPILQAALEGVRGKYGEIVAYIKPQNIASLKAFEAAGFRYVCDTEVRGSPCGKFVYEEQGG